MRRSVLCCVLGLGLVLTATTAQAASSQTKDPKYAGVPVFGFRNCTPTFECPSAISRERNWDISKRVIDIATSCSRTYLGIRRPDGLFEESFGLDGSLCLTTKRSRSDSSTSSLTPKCCVTPVPGSNNVCQVSCTLYGFKK
ncbi:MAG: hypothetical protein AB7E52_00660 [Bdellovibrionales bacterium]